MNFSNIKTPADLITQNDSAKSLLNLLEDISYEETLTVTKALVTRLKDFHQHMVDKGLEPDNDINPLGWACDHGKLESVLSILEEVE